MEVLLQGPCENGVGGLPIPDLARRIALLAVKGAHQAVGPDPVTGIDGITRLEFPRGVPRCRGIELVNLLQGGYNGSPRENRSAFVHDVAEVVIAGTTRVSKERDVWDARALRIQARLEHIDCFVASANGTGEQPHIVA